MFAQGQTRIFRCQASPFHFISCVCSAEGLLLSFQRECFVLLFTEHPQRALLRGHWGCLGTALAPSKVSDRAPGAPCWHSLPQEAQFDRPQRVGKNTTGKSESMKCKYLTVQFKHKRDPYRDVVTLHLFTAALLEIQRGVFVEG